MSLMVTADCLGCGACEMACPPGAIAQSEDFRVAYWVDPLLCNDCAECIPTCPVDALVPDDRFAVCNGRGCPLSSTRMDGWECTEGIERCGTCGTMLWRRPGDTVHACPRCDWGLKVMCPKVRRSEALQA